MSPALKTMVKGLFLVSWQLIAEVSLNSEAMACNQIAAKIAKTCAPVADALEDSLSQKKQIKTLMRNFCFIIQEKKVIVP